MDAFLLKYPSITKKFKGFDVYDSDSYEAGNLDLNKTISDNLKVVIDSITEITDDLEKNISKFTENIENARKMFLEQSKWTKEDKTGITDARQNVKEINEDYVRLVIISGKRTKIAPPQNFADYLQYYISLLDYKNNLVTKLLELPEDEFNEGINQLTATVGDMISEYTIISNEIVEVREKIDNVIKAYDELNNLKAVGTGLAQQYFYQPQVKYARKNR